METYHRHSTYKHNKQTNANIDIDEEVALQLMHKYRQNLNTQYHKPMHLTQTMSNTINQQKNNENTRISKLMLSNSTSSTLLPIKTETKNKSDQKHMNSMKHVTFFSVVH
eukprot:496749_1